MESHCSINEARPEDLTHIKGIGIETARNIVEYRNRHGGINDWEELRGVPGVTDRAIEEMRKDGCTLGRYGGAEREGFLRKLLKTFGRH